MPIAERMASTAIMEYSAAQSSEISEFASTVPVSGSAYTYSYVAFGELFAWIIGWDLLMEYAIGNIAVAISWSQYFVRVMEGFHIHIPSWLTMDYFTAHKGFEA